MSTKGLKPVYWIAASRRDLRSFLRSVQRAMGYALFRAQEGKKAPAAKLLKGIVKGAGVLEIVEDDDGDTYRVVYTVRLAEVVYVLHAFQKKSKKGTATPKHEIDLIRQRYETARADYAKRRQQAMTKHRKEMKVTEGSGNVFADLCLPDAEELLAKARLASAIADIIESRGLTQAEAAELMGTTQPKVSNLTNGRLEGFSFERLARFLNSLGRDVEIVVESHSRSRRRGRLLVTLGRSS